VVSQILIVAVQLFFIGELASLHRIHDLPKYGCDGDTTNSSTIDVLNHNSYTLAHAGKTTSGLAKLTSAATAAWLASSLPACPTQPTPPPTPPTQAPTPPPTNPTPAPSCLSECCRSDCKIVWPECANCCKANIHIPAIDLFA
jgi:hypothetical protein